jgi:N,N-dimethylformamidase beta subunit-like, C-terminal
MASGYRHRRTPLTKRSPWLMVSLASVSILLAMFVGSVAMLGTHPLIAPLQALRSTAVRTSTSTNGRLTAPSCQLAAKTSRTIADENACKGTANWRFDHPLGPDNAIEAFSVPASIDAGQRLNLYVSTTAPTYRFSIYRLGYYQGLGGRLMYSSGTVSGLHQPPPTIDSATRMVSCSNWRSPVVVPIPATWVSGVYIVKLLSSAGFMRYTLFIVRNDTSKAPVLVQIPLLTYQAYNAWGGYSLYSGRNAQGVYTYANRAHVVSFDRPYFENGGLMHLVLYDYDLLFWLERQGYSMSYSTDLDTDSPRQPLAQRRLIIFSGHTEYWSTAMRENVTAARDIGTSLAFFGANNVYWHVRLQNGDLGNDREEVCYKDATLDPLSNTDPQAATVHWREAPLNDPENGLIGQMYKDPVGKTAPLVLGQDAQPFLAHTALHVGSSLPGLLGGEFDRVPNNEVEPSGVSLLTYSPVQCQDAPICPPSGSDTASSTLYVASSGAKVFDAGTFFWSWGLHDDAIVPALPKHTYSTVDFQTFTANILAYLLQL